ncbi:MAG: sulfatase [Gemmatimonadales bacterium]
MTGPSADRTADQPGTVLLLAVWFGLVTGLGEGGLLLVRKFLLHRFLFAPLDAVWMAPITDVVLFVGVGLLLLLARFLLPRRLPLPGPVPVFAALGVFTILLMYGPLSRLAGGLVALGIGIQAGRMARRHPGRFQRVVKLTLPVAAFLVVLAGAGVRMWSHFTRRPPTTGQPAAASPNVLLIILDTVRAINLSAYGYERPTTPELERFAAQGVRFAHALSTAPWTLPSHASIFTGRFPHELSAAWLRPLDGTYPTLAEALAARGYVTGGFVANTRYCSEETGLARGFGHYEDYGISPAQILLSSSLGKLLVGNRFAQRALVRKNAETVENEFLRWLDRTPADRPYFAFLNFLDAHDPYQPPAPWDTLFSEPGAARYIDAMREDLPARRWPPETVRAAVDKYDESLAYLDFRLGVLFRTLEARGKLANTIVVVTSDHGEEFGEHGVFYHGNSLYRASVEVPLVIVAPGRAPAGAVLPGPVSLRDLPATILDLAGAETPFAGRSMARFWSGTMPDSLFSSDTLLMELGYSPLLPKGTPISRGSMASALTGGLRLIRNGDGTDELYDFVDDPAESADLASVPGYTTDLERLRGALTALTPSVHHQRRGNDTPPTTPASSTP